MRTFLFLMTVLVSQVAFSTSQITSDQPNSPPPSTVAPQDSNIPLTGSDQTTRATPSGNLDTVQTQSIGTAKDSHPESHPIPLP